MVPPAIVPASAITPEFCVSSASVPPRVSVPATGERHAAAALEGERVDQDAFAGGDRDRVDAGRRDHRVGRGRIGRAERRPVGGGVQPALKPVLQL